jgi:serpin B
MRAQLLLSICCLVLLAACRGNTPVALDPAPIASDSAKDLAARNNRFGLEFFKKSHTAGKNEAISPLSLAMALQMAATGADGETRKQMLAALHADGIDLPAANRELLDALASRKGVRLDAANSIWVDPGRMKLSDAFKGIAEKQFDAAARELDFADPKARDAINGWVSERTNKRIPELIDSIGGDAVAYLINAVYFKGEWTVRFDKERTENGEFTPPSGTAKQVPMMSRDGDFDYVRDGETQVARLGFGPANSASMWFALPGEDSSPAELLASMTPETLERWTKAAHPSELWMSLPRFTFRYKTEAGAVLRGLGMTDAFDSERADFSKLGASPAGRLSISRVLHEVFVEVNEEGAEAAAATAVEIMATSAQEPLSFDRPFLFAITDNVTGALLFIGIVNDPKS